MDIGRRPHGSGPGVIVAAVRKARLGPRLYEADEIAVET